MFFRKLLNSLTHYLFFSLSFCLRLIISYVTCQGDDFCCFPFVFFLFCTLWHVVLKFEGRAGNEL